MTVAQNVEFRRTFNLGDYENINLSTILYIYTVGQYEVFSAQIALIEQALVLFNCRKEAAIFCSKNNLAEFCEQQIMLLEKEKEELEKARINVSMTQPVGTLSPAFTINPISPPTIVGTPVSTGDFIPGKLSNVDIKFEKVVLYSDDGTVVGNEIPPTQVGDLSFKTEEVVDTTDSDDYNIPF